MMALLTPYSSLAEQRSTSPISGSTVTERKQTTNNHVKIEVLSNGGIKSYGPFNPLLKFG